MDLEFSVKRRPPMPILVLAVFAVCSALLPLAYLVTRASEAGWDKIATELTRERNLQLAANSLLLVAAVTGTAVLIGLLQAWLQVRTDLPWRGLFAVLATMPLAVPSFVAGFGWLSIEPSLNGFWPAWLLLSVGTAPYVFLASAAALLRFDPAAEDVAQSLGAGRWAVFWRVSWPAIRPAVTGSALLVSLYTLAEFGAVALFRFDTFTLGIYNAYRGSFDRTGAAVLALMLVAISLLVILGERWARGRRPLAAISSVRRRRVRLGIGRVPAIGLLVGFATLGVGIPLAAIIGWTLRGSSDWQPTQILEALANSVWLALLAGLAIGLVALAVALLTVRFPSRWSKLADFGVWLSKSLPGVVIGLSVVFIGANWLTPVYQTVVLLLFAYLVLFLPNGLAAMTAPLQQVSLRLDEVAHSLGSTTGQVMRRVVLPLASPGLLAGAALVALTVLKELPATLLLHPTGMDTLATRLWAETQVLSYSGAAPYALLLVLVGGLPALALNLQIRNAIREAQ